MAADLRELGTYDTKQAAIDAANRWGWCTLGDGFGGDCMYEIQGPADLHLQAAH